MKKSSVSIILSAILICVCVAYMALYLPSEDLLGDSATGTSAPDERTPLKQDPIPEHARREPAIPQSGPEVLDTDSIEMETQSSDGLVMLKGEERAALVKQLSGEFATMVAQYNMQLETTRPGNGGATPALSEIVAMDEVFQRLVKAHMESGSTLAEARNRLDAAVQWVRVPTVTRIGARVEDSLDVTGYEGSSFEGELSPKPVVLYLDVTLDGGGELSFCQGAYVVAEMSDRYRVRTVPYAVLRSKSDITIGYPFGEEVGVDYRSNGGIIIDTYNSGAAIPWVGLVAGPMGGADYLRVIFSRFDAEKQVWSSIEGVALEDVSAWEYNSTTRVLALHGYSDSTSTERDTGTIDIAALVTERMGKREK